MTTASVYDVIIIGGSHAGLSAAMALGRALRNVLVIDSGQPCNAPTPASYNFLSRDGIAPAELLRIAREQASRYSTITLMDATATAAAGSVVGMLLNRELVEVDFSSHTEGLG